MFTRFLASMVALALLWPAVVGAEVLKFLTDPNGSVEPGAEQVIDNGNNPAPVTAIPNTNYHFFNWTWPSPAGGGVLLGTNENPLTFAVDGNNYEITANFAPNVTPTVSTHGKLAADVTMKAGYSHTVTLAGDGIHAWGGDPSIGQAGCDDSWGVAAIGTGTYYSLAAKTSNYVYGYGKYYYPGNTVKTPSEVVPTDALKAYADGKGTTIKALAGGKGHSLALLGNGEVYPWGDDSYGLATVPATLFGKKVIAIAAGDFHNLALTDTNVIVAWGRRDEGALAPNAGQVMAFGIPGVSIVMVDDGDRSLRVIQGFTLAAIDAKGNHTVALTSDGRVLCWGANEYGQSTPPPGLSDVTAIAAGWYHTVALKADGTVVGWGDNRFGQSNAPAGLTGVTAIAAGGYHTLATKGDLTLVAWGLNDSGQCDIKSSSNLFNGIANGTISCSAPENYNGSSTCTISPNGEYSLLHFLVNGIPRSVEGNEIKIENITSNLYVMVLMSQAPGAPTGASAEAGDRAAVVNFTSSTPIGGGAIRGYKVVSSPAGGIDANDGSTGTRHTITNLENGKVYTFTVAATNDFGTGMSSLPSNSVVPKGNQAVAVQVAPPESAVFGESFTVGGKAPGGPVTYSSEGGCTNYGPTYTMTSGTTSCTVKMEQAGSEAYNEAVPWLKAVTARKAPQTITVGTPPPESAEFGESFTVEATAKGAVGYASEGGCSNSGTTFSMTSGTTPCTVKFTAGETLNYNQAILPLTVNAARLTQEIKVTSPPPGSALYNSHFTVAATTDAGAVVFGSSGGCSNIGATYSMTSGTTPCTVIFRHDGDDRYAPASASYKVTAERAPQSISVTTPPPSRAAYGESFTVVATADDGTLSYSSDGGCRNSGATYTMTSGTTPCALRIEQPGTLNFMPASSSATVFADKAGQEITVTSPAPGSAPFGSSFTVAALADGGEVSYSGSGGCRNQGATFTMTSGTTPCTVRFDQVGDADYTSAGRVTSSTTATKATQEITITKGAPPSALFGEAFTVAGTAPGGTVTYRGSGGCSNNGDSFTMISGSTPCTVFFEQEGDADYSAAPTKSSSTAAARKSQGITVTIPAPGSAPFGASFTVAAWAPGGEIVYGSAGGCKNSGATFTMTSGTTPCSVIYRQDGGADYEAGEAGSQTAAAKAPQTITIRTAPPASAPLNSTFTVEATAPGGAVSYASEGGCTNSGATFTMTSGSTPCTVVYQQAGDADYGAAPPERLVAAASKLAQAITILTPAPASARFGSSFTVAARAPGGEISYGSAGGCSNSGATFNVTSGTLPCTVLYDQGGGSGYQPAQQQSSVTSPLKGEQAITVTKPAPSSAVFGTSFTVAAWAPGGEIAYGSSGGCRNSGATFTMTSGTTPCTVLYDQGGNGDYAASSQLSSRTLAAPAAPGAPEISEVSAANGEARISFTPPSSNGGSAITSYTVTATPGNITGTGTGAPITVSGLSNGTPYTFRVRAINVAGEGADSSPTVAYTPLASGDVNGDGVVDTADALLALRTAAGMVPAGTAVMARGDVAPIVAGVPRGDGRIDVGDVLVILRKSLGMVRW